MENPNIYPDHNWQGILAELLAQLRQQGDLLADLVRAQRTAALYQRRLVISNQEFTTTLYYKDIIRIASHGNCCSVYASGHPKPICVSKNIGKFIEELRDAPFFFAISRRDLVNLHFVRKVLRKEGGQVVVQTHNGGENPELPLARKKRSELLDRWGRLP